MMDMKDLVWVQRAPDAWWLKRGAQGYARVDLYGIEDKPAQTWRVRIATTNLFPDAKTQNHFIEGNVSEAKALAETLLNLTPDPYAKE